MMGTRRTRPGVDLAAADEGIAAAITALRRGGPALLVDTPGDEGWLLCVAETASDAFASMASASGLGPLRAAIEPERLRSLAIPPVEIVSGLHAAVDAADARGSHPGDRAATLRALANPDSTPATFALPGQVSPIAAHDCTLNTPPCVARAMVELVRRTGAPPIAGCVPIGDVRRWRTGSHRAIPIVSLYEVLIAIEPPHDAVERQVEAAMPTRDGDFVSIAFLGLRTGSQYVVLCSGDGGPGTRVHLHQRCLAADVFRATQCGCGGALRAAQDDIRALGGGVIVYRTGDAHPLGTPPREISAGWPVTVELAAILRTLRVDDVICSANELIDQSALAWLGVRAASASSGASPAQAACS